MKMMCNVQFLGLVVGDPIEWMVKFDNVLMLRRICSTRTYSVRSQLLPKNHVWSHSMMIVFFFTPISTT